MRTNRFSLTDAALRLQLTYHQVRALVLRGALRGGRDEFGRFYVDARALQRFLRRAQRGGVGHAG